MLNADEMKMLTDLEQVQYQMVNVVDIADDAVMTMLKGTALLTFESLARTRIKSEERRRLLEKHQWASTDMDDYTNDETEQELYDMCPECLKIKESGHAPDCSLDAAVKGE
jgi:hypothetical protein